MTFLTALSGQPASMHHSAHGRYHALYQQLYSEAEGAGEAARDFVQAQLAQVRKLPGDLPEVPEHLSLIHI